MSDHELEALRRRGFGVAYRMLGSVADAEDVAQEALLRLAEAEEPPEEPAAWITTVATRLSIDHLRRARVRRETYVGPWLPEPLVEDAAPGPGSHAELADSISQAFLVVLEQLTPVERAAFLLREVFDYDYCAIAQIVDRSEDNARQIVARARKHVSAGRPRFDADRDRHRELLRRFLDAAEEGDLEALERLLAHDAVLYSDGGGRVAAARKPIHGATRIARLMVATTRRRRRRGGTWPQLATVNGLPGRLLHEPDGAVSDVLTIEVVDGRIQTVRVVRNPDKLAHIRAPVTGGDAIPSDMA